MSFWPTAEVLDGRGLQRNKAPMGAVVAIILGLVLFGVFILAALVGAGRLRRAADLARDDAHQWALMLENYQEEKQHA